MIALSFGLLVSVVLIFLNQRFHLFSSDHFPTSAHKSGAYVWLTLFVVLLSVLIAASSKAPATADQLRATPFWSLFTLHLILIVFLAGWWWLAGRPPVGRFLNLTSREAAQSTLLGVGVGVGGWLLTIAIALAIGLILSAAGLAPHDLKAPAMIPWMAALPIWKKAVIVFMAMTVEEAFYRGWLQKRTGLIVSTVLFALSHAGYGQPLMLIGVTVISTIIGITFWRTKNLVPCIIAHGVFDAVQLFVIVPLVLKLNPGL
ncbi:MAG: CPBP family intramembrane glutamic endopeptidase [Thermoanaerobaculia bacterium]